MEIVKNDKCLFCQIVVGESPSKKVWEDKNFLAIENKYPQAPVHVLVMPKEHIVKRKGERDRGRAKIRSFGVK